MLKQNSKEAHRVIVDTEKLQDIEQAVEKEHLALLALHDKRCEARAELNRQKIALWVGVAPKLGAWRPLIESVDYDAERFKLGIRGVKGADEEAVAALLQALQAIGRYKALADGATRRYELQERQWEEAAAALPSLREFAERVTGRAVGGRAGVRPDASEVAGRGADFFREGYR